MSNSPAFLAALAKSARRCAADRTARAEKANAKRKKQIAEAAASKTPLTGGFWEPAHKATIRARAAQALARELTALENEVKNNG